MGNRDARRLGLIEAALQGRITNQQGADSLGMSRRQFKRLRHRVAREGPQGLIHRSRGRPSSHQLAPAVREKVVALLTQQAARLNDCHVADLLAEDSVAVSADSVRRIRCRLGLAPKRHRRPPRHRRRRERQPAAGALVLVDGSPFPWLGEDQPRCTLVGALDDATGAILALTLRAEEDLHGYAVVLREVCVSYGLPLALYGDRTNIFVRNDDHWTLEEELQGRQFPTQMGRTLEELGIRYIAARSPQAKGRVERLWNTLQDRLAAELALRGIRTWAAALAFLPQFIARFNRRFARPAAATAVWRRPPRDLDRLLACRYERVVARDNTVALEGRRLQLPAGPWQRSYHGSRVELRELLDGRLLVFCRGQLLAEQRAPAEPFTLAPRRHHRPPPPNSSNNGRHKATQKPDRPRSRPKGQPPQTPPRAPQPTRSPTPDHPWRHGLPIPISRARV